MRPLPPMRPFVLRDWTSITTLDWFAKREDQWHSFICKDCSKRECEVRYREIEGQSMGLHLHS